MAVTVSRLETRQMETPDELRELPKTRIEIVELLGRKLMRVTFEPGWKWSECIRPTVATSSCQAAHLNYVISGTMHVVLDTGESFDMSAGSSAAIPPGHNAWVVGDAPCIMLDFEAGDRYGKA